MPQLRQTPAQSHQASCGAVASRAIGLRVAFVFERARAVSHGRRDRPPIVCRSPVLRTPFGRLDAPTSLAQRASLLAGTASDVRATWRPACVSAAFHRVTQRSKRRDGLSGQAHALPPTGATPVATGSAPRIVPRACFGAPRVLGQGLSRGLFPQERRATPRHAPCGAGEQQSNRTQRDVVSRARSYPLEPLRRSRRAATLT